MNEISDEDLNLFILKLDEKLESGEYPKLRQIESILKPHLSSEKIIAILGYLRRSGMIEVDLDGNITWIRRASRSAESSTLMDSAVMSDDFRKLIRDHNQQQYHIDQEDG